MPAEVAVILAVLVGAIWLLAKIFKGISALFVEIDKGYREAAATRKEKRYAQKRANLIGYINFLIPDELDNFAKKFEAVRSEFQQTRERTSWVAHRPQWKKVTFEAIDAPDKDPDYEEMCVEDLISLCPCRSA